MITAMFVAATITQLGTGHFITTVLPCLTEHKLNRTNESLIK